MNNEEIIKKQLGELNTKVASILQLLKGHELDPDDKGMVGVQNCHESRLMKLEKKIDRFRYFVIGMSLPAAWGLTNVIINMFTKN